MAAAQVADKLMGDEHADVLAESVAWTARALMEVQTGTELGERDHERLTHRNGY